MTSRLAGPVPLASGGDARDDVRTIRSPFDDAVIGEVPVCGAAHVERAVEAAEAAQRQTPLATWERAQILDRAAAALLRDRERFAQLIAAEAAKPITTARAEVDRAQSTFLFSSAVARTLAGEVVPLDASSAGADKVGFTLRVPVGIVGAITPFNFPLNLVAHKVAPAIAAGCPVVLKPADQTPFSAIALAELLLGECGLPPGWLSVVTGPGAVVGDAIVQHPAVAMVTFTGSPTVGWSIRSAAPRKRVSLELGNNAPVIIEPDGDWERAARSIRIAGFAHAGQSCISTQRVLVHDSIAERFTEVLREQVQTLKVGDPSDEEVDMSSVISPDERRRIESWIGEAVAAGARVVTGGDTSGTVLSPTVLMDVEADMKVSSREVFGPVVGIQRYSSFDDALRLANATVYGLQAAVFTSDVSRAFRAARELDFGAVLINEVPTWRADQQPYGGVRDSGNTREGPAYAAREMTESRLVVFDVSPLATDDCSSSSDSPTDQGASAVSCRVSTAGIESSGA
jgi:acyl-CoA reductase-like NAD-dependent aldehyde dehydrogenase